MVLAYMAQHVWEVIAGFLAVICVAQGLLYFIKGTRPRGAVGLSEGAARTVACFAMLLGVGIGVAAFTVDAEQPGAHGGNGWGGTGGVVVLGIWLVLMCAMEVLQFRKMKK